MKLKDFYEGQIVKLKKRLEDSEGQVYVEGSQFHVTQVNLRHTSNRIPGDGPNGFHVFQGYLKLKPKVKTNPFDKKVSSLPLLFIEEKEGMNFPFSPVK